MSHRPLAFVAALTGGDFLLWHLSLGANNVVLALIAGLTLPPLVAACALMLVLTATRLLSQIRPPAIPAMQRQKTPRRRPAVAARPALHHAQPEPAIPANRTARARGHHPTPDYEPAPATAAAKNRSPTPARKLAA